jgi:hypothetical protein
MCYGIAAFPDTSVLTLNHLIAATSLGVKRFRALTTINIKDIL